MPGIVNPENQNVPLVAEASLYTVITTNNLLVVLWFGSDGRLLIVTLTTPKGIGIPEIS